MGNFGNLEFFDEELFEPTVFVVDVVELVVLLLRCFVVETLVVLDGERLRRLTLDLLLERLRLCCLE